MELHSMANASSFSGDSSTSMNNDDEIKRPIESEEEEQEQSTDEIKIMIESMEENLGGPILSSAEELESLLQAEGGPKHLLDLLRFVLIPSSPWEIPSNELYVQLDYNASQLKSAGIKFLKKEDASNLFDIHFDKGVLTIPTIKMFDQTELLLRNLMAFEQGKPATSRYFTAYATFMDGLIDTDKDVALLTEQGIIINCLGSPEIVAVTFNNITKGVFVSPYFNGVVKDLNDYYNKPWNKLMENLRQTYFNSPWAGISVAAAAVVIILTIIQTICSLLQI